MRILYVEDEADIRELACLALGEMGGHEVHAFDAGPDALAALDGLGALDLLLLDVMMPGMDGRALLRALRDRPAAAAVPAIFMTAKTMPSEVAELLALGAAHVVSKPFDVLALDRELGSAIGVPPPPMGE